jgi:hypothetical protein
MRTASALSVAAAVLAGSLAASATPPAQAAAAPEMSVVDAPPGLGRYRDQVPVFGRCEAALDEWAAERDAEYHLGRTGRQVRATVTRLVAAAARRPIAIGDHRLDDNSIPLLLQVWLNDEGDDPALARAVQDGTSRSWKRPSSATCTGRPRTGPSTSGPTCGAASPSNGTRALRSRIPRT